MIKVTSSAEKFMLTVFSDYQGVLFAHFQKRGENVNSASYCQSSVEASGSNSQKTSGPTGKRSTASS
jgi:hypothetical protein